MQKSVKCTYGVIAGSALAGMGSVAHATISQDGVLDPSEGYTLVSTQTNVTTSQNANGGGPSGPGNEATATSTGNFTQLSNCYAVVTGTGASATLNLFVGGSVTQDQNTSIDLALQTNGNGVSSLAGQTINGEEGFTTGGALLQDITFDSGFKPNAYIILNLNQDQNGGTGTGTSGLTNNYFTDLTGGNATAPTITGTLDNALVNTPIGTGATGDPGFAAANTGLEFSVSLASLGYTDGSSIEALLFPSVGGDNRTDNQILAPITYNSADGSGGYDYTYYDNNEGGVAGRQFTGVDYIGNQYFSIPGASVPEPASLSLVALAGAGLLGRRTRKA